MICVKEQLSSQGTGTKPLSYLDDSVRLSPQFGPDLLAKVLGARVIRQRISEPAEDLSFLCEILKPIPGLILSLSHLLQTRTCIKSANKEVSIS